MTTRLMLLDTASLYFRAYYGVPSSVTAPDGTPINAVRGLLDFISRLVTDHSPTDLVAAWDDDWRPEFRVAAIPSYKAHRLVELATNGEDVEEIPDALEPQVELIREVLRLLGIPRVGAPGFEADDVIATLATRSSGAVAIVSGDRDLFQLVDDERPIFVLYTAARGVGGAEVINNAAIEERYGVSAASYADFALLRGDASDGLPGVRGIGEKTAARLIQDFGSVAGLVAAVRAGTAPLTPAMQQKVRAGFDYLDRARPVVRVVRDIPIPAIDSRLPTVSPTPAELAEFADRWGLTNSVSRVARAFGWS